MYWVRSIVAYPTFMEGIAKLLKKFIYLGKRRGFREVVESDRTSHVSLIETQSESPIQTFNNFQQKMIH
jgi:hypothetical protein